MKETDPRWICHVQRRPINTTVGKMDSLDIIGTSDGKENMDRDNQKGFNKLT